MSDRVETEWYPYQAFMSDAGTSEEYSITITFKTKSGKSVEFHIPHGGGAVMKVGHTTEWESDDFYLKSLPRKVSESYDFALEFNAIGPDDPYGSHFTIKREGLDKYDPVC